MFGNHLFRFDTDAERFGHRAPFVVEGPAIGGALAIRSGALESDTHQERAVEPSTVLVAALQVHIGWPRQAIFRGQYGKMARSGIEPDIENIAFLAKFSS